jgi:hypothetical protein
MGMMAPPVSGHVLNACNDKPLAGAEVLIKIEAGLVNPGDWQPRVISETTVITDEEGFYKKPFSIGGPKGLFFSGRYPEISVKKDGYANSVLLLESRLNQGQYTSYLIPKELYSYERMQWLWGTGMGYAAPPGVNVNDTSKTFKKFLRESHRFNLASQVAETEKDIAFLDLFCLRVRQDYSAFSDSDHASLRDYLEAFHRYDGTWQLTRLPIDSCIIPEVRSTDPSVYTLSDKQWSHVFRRPECGDVSIILTPSSN